jgi:hypothetical protein
MPTALEEMLCREGLDGVRIMISGGETCYVSMRGDSGRTRMPRYLRQDCTWMNGWSDECEFWSVDEALCSAARSGADGPEILQSLDDAEDALWRLGLNGAKVKVGRRGRRFYVCLYASRRHREPRYLRRDLAWSDEAFASRDEAADALCACALS